MIPHRLSEPYDERLQRAYREAHKARFSKPGVEFLLARALLKDIIGKRPMLEVGCGCGGYSFHFAQTFPNIPVVGTDIDEEAIEIAKATYQRDNLTFRVDDAYQLQDRNLGLIISNDGLHHLDRLDDAAASMYDALGQNSCVYVRDLNREKIDGLLPEHIQMNLFNFRLESSPEEFFNALEEDNFLIKSDPLMLASVLSFMAAYTPEEVRNAFEGCGFSVDLRDDGQRYNCMAWKRE